MSDKIKIAIWPWLCWITIINKFSKFFKTIGYDNKNKNIKLRRQYKIRNCRYNKQT